MIFLLSEAKPLSMIDVGLYLAQGREMATQGGFADVDNISVRALGLDGRQISGEPGVQTYPVDTPSDAGPVQLFRALVEPETGRVVFARAFDAFIQVYRVNP